MLPENLFYEYLGATLLTEGFWPAVRTRSQKTRVRQSSSAYSKSRPKLVFLNKSKTELVVCHIINL
jgi:hypothetical protein